MSELEKLGVTAKRRLLLDSGEETTADKVERTELAFTLPKSKDVQASFSSENLGTMLRKVFKKEIQTGDPLFDEAVNIRTDSVDATAALLESTVLRASIESLVINRGTLELDGPLAKIELPGEHAIDAELALNVVRALVE